MIARVSKLTTTGDSNIDKVLNSLVLAINRSLDSVDSSSSVKTSDYVGEIRTTPLSTSSFRNLYGEQWIYCDGSSCAGSKYSEISGNNTVPDLSAHIAGINYFIKIN